MKTKVYFIAVDNSDKPQEVRLKFSRLLEESRVLDFINKGERVTVKMHFGEADNTGFVKPEYARLVCDVIRGRQATPFLAETNTLYRGRRTNSQEHLKLAYEHGFTADKVGADIVITDDTRSENIAEVKVNQRFIKSAKIAKIFLEADALVGIAHFKGHLMTGFGGALKNIGMGCASREGKLAQHSDVSPIVYKNKCTGCGLCAEACPVKAITIQAEKSFIERLKCIGCASCIATCPYYAIDVDWEKSGDNIQEKMVEYAKAVLEGKKNRVAFINFGIKITKECDCLAKDDPRIVSDVGLFASLDPVAIDKASLDLANKAAGRDVFKEAHPNRDGLKQLRYACLLGLGNLEYELVDLSGRQQAA
jgi:hypothetical protein